MGWFSDCFGGNTDTHGVDEVVADDYSESSDADSEPTTFGEG